MTGAVERRVGDGGGSRYRRGRLTYGLVVTRLGTAAIVRMRMPPALCFAKLRSVLNPTFR